MTEDPLKPRHGRSTIHVAHDNAGRIDFSQILTYFYEDTTEKNDYYQRAKNDDDFIPREQDVLGGNMQTFLNKEKNIVNGKKVRPKVVHVDISYESNPRFIIFSWLIQWSGKESDSESGMHAYESSVDPAVLEYNVQSYYHFPDNAKIMNITSSLAHEVIEDHIIIYKASKGDKVRSSEKIKWMIES